MFVQAAKYYFRKSWWMFPFRHRQPLSREMERDPIPFVHRYTLFTVGPSFPFGWAINSWACSCTILTTVLLTFFGVLSWERKKRISKLPLFLWVSILRVPEIFGKSVGTVGMFAFLNFKVKCYSSLGRLKTSALSLWVYLITSFMSVCQILFLRKGMRDVLEEGGCEDVEVALLDGREGRLAQMFSFS